MKRMIAIVAILLISLAFSSVALDGAVGYQGAMPQNAGREIFRHALRVGVNAPQYEAWITYGVATSKEAPIAGLKVDYLSAGGTLKFLSEDESFLLYLTPYAEKLWEFSDHFGGEVLGLYYPDPYGPLGLRVIAGGNISSEHKTMTRNLQAEDAKAYRVGGGVTYGWASVTLGYAEWWAVRGEGNRMVRGPFLGLEAHWPFSQQFVTRLTVEKGKLTTHNSAGTAVTTNQTVISGSVVLNIKFPITE